MDIPAEIVDWFRDIFAAVNLRLAERIRNVPAIPEPHLDTRFIEHLMGYAVPRAFSSGWGVRIDTHYFGGLQHFGTWELAGFGVFIFFQRTGSLIRQKVALLQSKRLYPTAGEIDHLEEYDYRIGMARLAKRDKHAPSMMSQRAFAFKPTSPYKALIAHDEQYDAIGKYMKLHHTPVFYLLYNPPSIPTHVQAPLTEYVVVAENPLLGSRVIPFQKIVHILKTKKKGYSPSITDLAGAVGIDSHGWRLEHFMADLLLSCKEGRRVTEADAGDMQSLFFRRSGPIAATVAVTIEVPEGTDLPE